MARLAEKYLRSILQLIMSKYLKGWFDPRWRFISPLYNTTPPAYNSALHVSKYRLYKTARL